ncbi:NodT family efflux transporter outer membrane factor (OMF) lipoprotein [Collimonas sp. PA-H2]|uniref:efflux transporter outer membrane subunit n=1 Tax=Collimonas sp. PA-H2 TaxID=1881062 RepID=UPI000BF550B9|nr:efflux transporter outer membrane subunit [Collimonas sp. PA-H2]PFH10256.1 NodT family efflux transporter outer membrane factor (OMF) lipoprotein [Collimonas sp. PA-H2]
MTTRTITLLLVVALAACAGPKPAPPLAAAVAPPAAWRDDSAPGSELASGWWQGFGDPVLTKIVETALANNLDVAMSAARVEAARAQFRLSEAQRLPNLAGSAGGGRQRDVSPFGKPQTQTAGQAELSVSYDLDLFGRLASASSAARASLLASTAAHDNVRLAVAASAASGYITLRALDARLAVLHDTLAARSASLKLARRRAEAGYSSMLDLRQAEAEYSATEQLIPAAELAIRRQEDGLSLLLGDNPHGIERGSDLAALTAPSAASGLPSALLRRRPDIATAEQQLVAADHSLDAARAAFMPNIQLTASGGYVASTLLTSPIAIFALGGSVLAPIFDSGRLRAQADTAAARRDEAAYLYRKTALTAFKEVDESLNAIRRNADQEQAIADQRQALARALTLATSRYRAGYSPYLEQLDAQRSLLSTELTLIQVRADRLIAAVNLFQALGGGWQNQG